MRIGYELNKVEIIFYEYVSGEKLFVVSGFCMVIHIENKMFPKFYFCALCKNLCAFA